MVKSEKRNLWFEVVRSGSDGNCVVIENIMIDIGIPWKHLKPRLFRVKYILITHTHSDHLDKRNYEKIKKEFPRIKFIGNWQVHQVCPMDFISVNGTAVKFKDDTFIPFECHHDVPVQGFVFKKNGYDIIYATDTWTLKDAPKGMKYDYLFIESNHDHIKIEKARDDSKGRYNPYLSAQRHLSTKDCKTFYYMNRKSKDSMLIELHKSKRFY